MLVISDVGTVSVQFDNERLAMIDRNTNTWLAHLDSNPKVLERHVLRGGLSMADPKLFDRIRERVERGFMGELATAVYLREPYQWRLLNADSDEFDVAGVQVRTVDNYTKRLITHQYDKPAPYVLAVADYGTRSVVLRGWLHLRHCNVPAHWEMNVPKPAFFTPATALHPMDTLREHHQQRKRRLSNGI